MRALLVVLGSTLTLLAAPAGASALTVSAAGGVITVQAAPGEANSVFVAPNAANLRFQDSGTNLDGTPVVVTAGAGCVQAVAATTVDCVAAGVTSIVVNLLDRNDSVFFNGIAATVAVTANGGDGRDSIAGGPGNDVLSGGDGGDGLNGLAGNDTMSGGGGDDQFDAGAGDDQVAAGPGDDSVAGGPGSDTVTGEGGNDTLFSDPGNDSFSGGDGIDTYDARQSDGATVISLDGVANDTNAEGTDNVQADVETLAAGGGDDTLTGSSAANVIDGGGGDDTINGLDGADSLSGRGGNDRLNGGAADDVLSGDSGDDVADGGAGNDGVNGGDGADQLLGGDGTDSLAPGIGRDSVSGGEGIDTVNYFNSGISASLDGLANDGQPGDNGTIAADVENVTTGSGNDVVTGGPGANVITTGAGDDVINARDGVRDLILCGLGFDTVIADGADVIDASTGPCESIDTGDLKGFGPAVAVALGAKARTTVKVTATCSVSAIGFCQGTITLLAGRRAAGSTTFFLLPGQSAGRTIKLGSAAQKALLKRRRLAVSATVSSRDARGATRSAKVSKTLKL